ncbi:MAG: S-methyl-5-thioribose kinase [Rhizobiales bacterium]|nr:S-methyl-5-thioribose kinase [Hyphomicrobiales bacterium]
MTYTPSKQYKALGTETITGHLASISAVRTVLGDTPDRWQAEEVGDGNLNLVFIVRAGRKSVIAKQALPYVRLVGESWPLPLSRAYFEHEALMRQEVAVPGLTPKLIAYDHDMALIVMEHLTPHIILRKGFIAGQRYPYLAEHAGRFMAETLFSYSDLALDGETKRNNVALFSGNHVMCALTEQVIFDDPYFDAPLNRHTSPQLDALSAEIRHDSTLKIAAQELKTLFMSKTQTLLHGDLHTGSIMVTEDDTRVIDPEFAFYGPMGFDIGALMANFLLAYFSQRGHATATDDRIAYGEWLLQTLLQTFAVFEAEFSALWRQRRVGSLYPESLFDGDATAASERALSGYLRDVMVDSIGFTGAKMLRRILGIAHVEDMEAIADPDLRAACEAQALALARILITDRARISSFDDVVRMAREIGVPS